MFGFCLSILPFCHPKTRNDFIFHKGGLPVEKKRSSPDAPNRKRFPDGLRNLQARQEYITYVDHSSIRVRTTEKEPNRDDHWHSAAEIMLISHGEAVYTLPDKTYRLTAGQILIVPADCSHTLKEKEGTQRFQFLFEPTYLLHLRDMSVMSPLIKCPIYLSDESDAHRQVRELLNPIDMMDGDSLPVSAFVDHADGTFELGAAAYEKRGVAVSVPTWDSEKCIQCNQCAYVCPHATIRPFALTEDEAKAAPASAKIVDVKAGKGKGVYKFAMAVSPLDCMGCGVCVGVCPTNALTMVAQEGQLPQQDVFDYCVAKVSDKKDMQDNTVKGSQFKQPMLEFSGSCAGCAETSYARLVSQLFGDRMFVSNATGCSSIWGGPAATSPYCTNKEGKGPAWINSLFEDNAEHGLGLMIGQQKIRDDLADMTRQLIDLPMTDAELNAKLQHSYAQSLAGEGRPFEEVFDELEGGLKPD